MTPRHPLPVRLYDMAARLLPPDLRDSRPEMVHTFAALWAEPRGVGQRTVLLLGSLVALGAVTVVEWLEYLGVRRAPGRARQHTNGNGRGGMGLLRNVRFALRTVRRAPAFALTSILLVAVGVGSVTAIFTLVDHVLLRPLPYPDADRLVTLDNGSFTGPFFRQLQTMQTVRDWVAGSAGPANLVGDGEPRRVSVAWVSEGFMALFGAHAQRGRLLNADDFRSADAVVLSARLWHSVWNGDPSVIGRAIQVDGQPLTVVGVMDDAFSPPEPLVGREVDLWRPLDWSDPRLADDHYYVLSVAGRMRPGTEIPGVQHEVDALAAHMAAVNPVHRTRAGGVRHYPVLALDNSTVRSARNGLDLLMGAVALLLLVACANVANLFLARGLSRTREMSVRRALGAGTPSLVGQLLVESLVVGLLGGALGTLLARGGIRTFLALEPTAVPRADSVTMDGRILAFAVVASALTSLVFGLLPALRSVRSDVNGELRGGGRTATSGRGVAFLRNALVTGELALSLVLVAGAGLLLRSFLAVRSQDPGFRVAGVWTVPLNLSRQKSPEAFREVMDGILRQVEGVSGVRSAAYALTAPLQWTGGRSCCWSDNLGLPSASADTKRDAMIHPVTVEYFRTLGMDLVAGRAWTRAEASADPVPVVVNETLARAHGGDRAVLGLTGKLGRTAIQVVGVARDNRHYGLDQPVRDAAYLPMEQIPFAPGGATLMVQVDRRSGGAMPQALRKAIWAAQPDVPVPTVRSLQASVDASTGGRRFDAAIFGTFAGLALLLAAGGVYGTLLYLAGEQRRAFGIRMALGASRGRLEAHVLRNGLVLGLTGVALGLAGAWASNRLLQSRIWGVGADDPWSLGSAAAVLLFTAVVASWLPARRAGRVDPVETLRAE